MEALLRTFWGFHVPLPERPLRETAPGGWIADTGPLTDRPLRETAPRAWIADTGPLTDRPLRVTVLQAWNTVARAGFRTPDPIQVRCGRRATP